LRVGFFCPTTPISRHKTPTVEPKGLKKKKKQKDVFVCWLFLKGQTSVGPPFSRAILKKKTCRLKALSVGGRGENPEFGHHSHPENIQNYLPNFGPFVVLY